jgi:hypothetical protein
MKFAVYDKATGEILKHVSGPPDHVAEQVGDNEEFYLNCPESATRIVDNEPVAEIQIKHEVSDRLRIMRNQALTNCDWTQLLDAPLSPEKRKEWATYRQRLRDMDVTVAFDKAVWPPVPILVE